MSFGIGSAGLGSVIVVLILGWLWDWVELFLLGLEALVGADRVRERTSKGIGLI